MLLHTMEDSVSTDFKEACNNQNQNQSQNQNQKTKKKYGCIGKSVHFAINY